MALSGLDIYKLLPKTNCRECGFVTCLAFAMQLAKKAVTIEKCPYLSKESKNLLEASSQPPIKLVSIGQGDDKLDIGNETVMFRHEEKFHHPCGIGFIIEDSLSLDQIKQKLVKINQLKFERVGQALNVNLVAVKQTGKQDQFLKAVEIILNGTKLGLVLMSDELDTLEEAAKIALVRKPLLYHATSGNVVEIAKIASELKLPVVATEADLEKLSKLTKDLSSKGISEIILDAGNKPVPEKIWDFTQIRRQALKKSNRTLGYPIIAVTQSNDPYEEVIEAATYISKYAGIILLKNCQPEEALGLMTLRQNIYTDPQKPLQIEPKIYPVGAVTDKSPVMVTTNFSLSYFTVLGEVEASKVPSYIISVDTEGMSVLTAWAAEKFTPEKIADSINKFGVKDVVSHKRLIIPGYVAMMSGDLEEKSGLEIIVGPKEAAGLPSFLKNL